MGQTNRIMGLPKREPKARFRYFLVPQDRLMERLYLTKTSTVMGRDPASDLPVENSDVSWRHCLLDVQARGVFILDLDSTNGTFVNGILIRDGYLNPGDRIELGPCTFIINREALDSI
jgi:pSer/pThr/pTyr-binding forkhead associated (FHA) protein